MRRVLALLLFLTSIAPASAQTGLVAHWRGNDVELEAGIPAGPCVGDLQRGELAPWWVSTSLGPQTACPITLGGEGQLSGVEETVAYGLFDAAIPATGSLALRTERHFDVVADPAGFPLANIYFVSVPMIAGVDDLANTAAPELNKCVGDAGGPASPDGVLNADDLLCSWWTSRATGQGSMTISRRDEATATWQTRVAFVDTVTGLVDFQGPWTAPLDPRNDGYMVTVDGAVGTTNHVLVTGGHDPSFIGRTISPATDTTFVLPVPHHYMDVSYTADSLLCGLEGVDWCDCDSDGDPDQCVSGVYDGAHAVSVVTFDNDPTSITANMYVTRSAFESLGQLRFLGPRFTIKPGQAYMVVVTSVQMPRTWLLPHF